MKVNQLLEAKLSYAQQKEMDSVISEIDAVWRDQIGDIDVGVYSDSREAGTYKLQIEFTRHSRLSNMTDDPAQLTKIQARHLALIKNLASKLIETYKKKRKFGLKGVEPKEYELPGEIELTFKPPLKKA